MLEIDGIRHSQVVSEKALHFAGASRYISLLVDEAMAAPSDKAAATINSTALRPIMPLLFLIIVAQRPQFLKPMRHEDGPFEPEGFHDTAPPEHVHNELERRAGHATARQTFRPWRAK